MQSIEQIREMWYEQLSALLEIPMVQQYLMDIGNDQGTIEGLASGLQDLCRETTVEMASYAQSWERASGIHSGEGVYAEAIEQWKVSKEALIVDLGCGSGGLLVELAKQGYRRLIGVDINPFMMEICARRLQEYAPTTILGIPEYSFSMQEGFVLRGSPVMPEPCGLKEPFVIADNLVNPQNLIRLLGVNGACADHVIYMLPGGIRSVVRGQFISAQQSTVKGWELCRQVRFVDILHRLHMVQRKGGRLHLGLRVSILDLDNNSIENATKEEMMRTLQQDQLDCVQEGYRLLTEKMIPLSPKEKEYIELSTSMINAPTINDEAVQISLQTYERGEEK